MPARRELTMRQLRQMLRLAHEGVSARAIGRTLGAARSTVQDNLKRAEAAGLAWPLDAEITDAVLEQRLFARASVRPGVRRRCCRRIWWMARKARRRVEPDWSSLAREAKRPGVNLMVLWEEYRVGSSRGLRLLAVLRAVPRVRAGGCRRRCGRAMWPARRCSSTIRRPEGAIVDLASGEVRQAQIFVAVLGASSLHLRRGELDPGLPDWVGAHGHAFGFFGGVPRQTVPDYVTGHIIGLLCRSTLCGQRLAYPSRVPIGGTSGHISFRARQASRARQCRRAIRVFGGTPPRRWLAARKPAVPPLSSGC